ncbi:HSF-type DNA-binding protein [Nitzschia inconspicua]|uniref:HSF-type DNA-binding protein n=1 Tax=Nitzschia inconspicua TaxID=303405 RepID=A0A9K3M6Z3_9STRA|nr:HSF-type DNA-binding protein [Nitzschia inconspicua]
MTASIGTQNIFDLLNWDLTNGAIMMNEAIPEINQRPLTSRVGEEASHDRSHTMTKEEVTAAAAVASLAAKAASMAAVDLNIFKKRERSEADQTSTPSSLSSCSSFQDKDSEQAERSRQKIARLDGHSVGPSTQASPGATTKSTVPPATQHAKASDTSATAAPLLHQQMLPLGPKPPSAPATPLIHTTSHTVTTVAPTLHQQMLPLGPKPPPAPATPPTQHGTTSDITAAVAPPLHQQMLPLGPKPPPAPATPAIKHGTTSGTVEGEAPPLHPQHQPPGPTSNSDPSNSEDSSTELVLRPFPYFYYRDFSTVPDPDPFTPLTAPGRVPNFPAKMHSILSRADLVDIVAWMPHGRAWRVLKPREFECRVIPTYFEHAKFSSFIRQANGWGFRRLTQGKDRNAYYHEMFLRGLPHLCKMMKRPGVSEKQSADPDQEPDFYKITEEHPVPEQAEDDSILLQCTLQGGPKARMPVYFGALPSSTSATGGAAQVSHSTSSAPGQQYVHPEAPSQHSNPFSLDPHHTMHPPAPHMTEPNRPSNLDYSHAPSGGNTTAQAGSNGSLPPSVNSVLPQSGYSGGSPSIPSPIAEVLNQPFSSDPAKQFAAGFAAAASLSHEQLQKILSQALSAAPPKTLAPSGHPSDSSPAQQQVYHQGPPVPTGEHLYLPTSAAQATGHHAHNPAPTWKDHGQHTMHQDHVHTTLPTQQHHGNVPQPISHHQHYQTPPSPPHRTSHRPQADDYHPHYVNSQTHYHSYPPGPAAPPGPPPPPQHHHPTTGASQYGSATLPPQPTPTHHKYPGGESHQHHYQQQHPIHHQHQHPVEYHHHYHHQNPPTM